MTNIVICFYVNLNFSASGLRLIVKDDGTLALSTAHELPECGGRFDQVIVAPR